MARFHYANTTEYSIVDYKCSLSTEVYINLRTRNMVLDTGTLTQILKEPGHGLYVQCKKWQKLAQSCFEFNFQTNYEQALLTFGDRPSREI